MEKDILEPNYTQIPNVILDDLMHDMTESELRVVLAICRKTFGWQKIRDRLSISQLMELTGMSNNGVLNGLTAGIKRGIIKREARGQGFIYELIIQTEEKNSHKKPVNLVIEPINVVNRLDTKPVNEVNIQKKEFKQTIKKKEDTNDKPVRDPLLDNPAVKVYKGIVKTTPNETQRKIIADAIPNDSPTITWEQSIKHWLGHGWSKYNVKGIVDSYLKGGEAGCSLCHPVKYKNETEAIKGYSLL